MRCVCKPWNALLSEASFIKSHLYRSIHKKDEVFIFFSHRETFNCSPFKARPSCSPDLALSKLIKLPVNPQSKFTYGNVIGSVNGLICFYYYSCHGDFVLHMWNPSLSAVLTLPPCSLPSVGSNKTYFRFGYDPKTDDYIVVKLTTLFRAYYVLPKVEVYSMRKGSWKLITQRFPSHITLIMGGDRVCEDDHDGHLHWLGFAGLKCDLKTIVAFDLGAQTFCEIPLPHSILDDHRSHCHYLGVLSGKLCMMSRIVGDGGALEVWVMNEYGIVESWVKHCAFSQFGGGKFSYGFTSHAEFIFEVDGNLCLYDPAAAQTKTFKIMMDIRDISKIVEYVDSLVWVALAEHELSKGHLPISILKSHRLLKGPQKAIKGVSGFLFSGVKRATKGNKSAPILLYVLRENGTVAHQTIWDVSIWSPNVFSYPCSH